jgi:Asp-tRNA(Asn)/Glu-tRNA(Gln) amidotransferase C subunit
VAKKGLELEKVLLNVKEHENGLIKVPPILEE